jgi:glutamate/aspartate transport system permease protein
MTYTWNWHCLLEPSPMAGLSYLGMLLQGLAWTAASALGAWILACMLGALVGVARTLPMRPVARAATAYVELFRNIPLLIQLFLWYFVLPELLPPAWGLWLKGLPDASFYTTVLGLGLFTSARVAEQVRAGLQALPRGQALAAAALGLSLRQSYLYVLLPMGLRMMLPPLASELLNTVKNTSMALTIGLLELTAQARAMQEFSFQVFEAFTAATLLYLATNATVAAGLRALERRVAVPGYLAGETARA